MDLKSCEMAILLLYCLFYWLLPPNGFSLYTVHNVRSLSSAHSLIFFLKFSQLVNNFWGKSFKVRFAATNSVPSEKEQLRHQGLIAVRGGGALSLSVSPCPSPDLLINCLLHSSAFHRAELSYTASKQRRALLWQFVVVTHNLPLFTLIPLRPPTH